MKGNIILVSGPAGIGKSTTATLLSEGLEKSTYISGDTILLYSVWDIKTFKLYW